MNSIQKIDTSPDDGVSLLELVVVMAVMAIFLAIVTGSVQQLFAFNSNVSALTTNSTNLNQLFVRVDRQVRYATAIDTPNQTAATSTGPWFVEWVSTATGVDACTQLRMSGGTLSERTWTGTSPGSVAYRVVASNLNPQTNSPFTFYTANGTQTFQRLAINVGATDAKAGSSGLSATFTAMNSSQASTTNDGSSLVCQSAGGRT